MGRGRHRSSRFFFARRKRPVDREAALQAIKDLERQQHSSHSASDPIGDSGNDFSHAVDLGTIGGGTP